MTPPLGFGPTPGPGEPQANDPFGLSGLFGPAFGGELMAGLQQLLSWQGGPVNWDLARQVATAATGQDDPEVTSAQAGEVEGACRLADLWLDAATTFPAAASSAHAWTRTGWVEATLPAWRRLVDPVAGRVVEAMGAALEKGMSGALEEGALPEGVPAELLSGLGGPGGLGAGMKGVMGQVGGLVFGAQVGQALGALAAEVLGSAEIGLPLGEAGRAALLPANVVAFSEGLEIPEEEVRLYLALRESAAQRLFGHVPWLAAHLYDAVDAYARGIEVDPAAIEQAVSSLDPGDPASIQQAMSTGLFRIEPTPAQQAALVRLETALALVEGWVDVVVDAAAGSLPSAGRLRETIRRRRASGGPAEETFATLVGLQLRPRRLREAAALWARLGAERTTAGRDGLWAHPDLLPGPADLDDPAGFLSTGIGPGEASGGTDWDAALRDLDEPPAGG